MLKLAFLSLFCFTIAASATIDPSLKSTLKTKATANIFISFNVGTSSVLNNFAINSFETRADRLTALSLVLKEHASSTQQNVLDFLSSKPSVDVTSFWINNQVFVRNADLELVEALGQFAEIDEIIEEEFFEIDVPIESREGSQPSAIEWGIQKIEAPKAWAHGNDGKGVRVATIDTGVRVTHQALAGNFFGEHGWFDPYRGTASPNDQNGHGTHTTGTIAGQGGIGVAPGSKWLACKGCATSSCAQDALISCGQFMVCPTKTDGSDPDCSKAPHLVSNSWGGGRGRPMYNEVINAWQVAGIIPIFSNGNSGPFCNSANSPADNPNVIAVGSTTSTDALSSFSSVGPSIYNTLKPDVSAPGSNVNSAYNTADDAYRQLSGTSMASPHVAGVVALLKAENPDLTYEEIKKFLYDGAETETLTPTGRNCGGVSDDVYPNHSFGNGRINAYRSLQSFAASKY